MKKRFAAVLTSLLLIMLLVPTAAFATGGHTVNGDLNLIGIENGQLFVYGIPWCGTSGIFTTKEYPLGGIVLLGRSQEREQIEELSASDKILRVMQRMISPAWTEELLSRNLSFASEIADKVPVFHLSCTMHPSAAQTAKDEIDRQEALR